MKIVEKRGPLGLVVNTAPDPTGKRPGISSAHVVLDRYTVDEDSNICLTPPLEIEELYASIEVLKAELDALLARALQDFLKRHDLPDGTAVH